MRYTGGAVHDMPRHAVGFCTHPECSPGWKERPNEDMKRIIYERLNEYKNGWVMEGNYMSVLGGMDTFTAATDVICT
jgi:hypothetical protein